MKTSRVPAFRGLFLAAFTLSVGTLTAPAGDIEGRVSDANTGAFLPGASVTAIESGVAVVSDRHGRFHFSGIPEGIVNLRVDYVGYDAASEKVNVPATGSVNVTIDMGAGIVRLEKFAVQGYREGRSRALQQKRTQTNITDIISSDAIGNLPDRNVAEAASRIPGVSLSFQGLDNDQGEGIYVSIRGIDPNLNQVTMDGNTMAAPGGSRLGRAVPLNVLGAGQVSQIEVIKSVTPDMDANSLGGTLNLKTASAFDRHGRFISGSVSGVHNQTASTNSPAGRFTYSDLLGPGNKWGFTANVTYDEREYSDQWVQASWSSTTINGAQMFLPNDFEVKPETGSQKRGGADLNLEYRPDADTQFYVRAGYARKQNWLNTFEIINTISVGAADVTLDTPTSGIFKGKNRTERREFRTQKEQRLQSVNGGFKKTMNRLTLEGQLSYSGAHDESVHDNSRQFRNANGQTGPIAFDLRGFSFTKWVEDYTIDVPSNYPMRRTRDDFGLTSENTSTAKVDLRWDSNQILGHTGYLKTGFKALRRQRTVDLTSVRLVPKSGTNFTLATIGTKPSVPVYDGRYQSGFLIDWDKTNAFIAANPDLVTHDTAAEASNSAEDDYSISEYIYSTYVMGSVNVDRLTLMGGLRWEKTDATIRSVEARTFAGAFLGEFPNSGTFKYDNYFPNIQGTYHFTDRLLLRAAHTQTIGRPAYEDARPFGSLQYDNLGNSALNPAFPYAGSLSIGNPQLKPYFGRSYDLSLEWYVGNSGIISLAAFRKDIANPIYNFSERQRNVVHNGLSFETLDVSTRRNGTAGRISGLEFNVYLPFRFLRSPFDGFGIDANLTAISSSETIPTRPGENLPFFRQPSKLRNFTFFYDKANFSARIAFAYASDQLYSFGSLPQEDVWVRPRNTIDTQFKYRINTNYSITAAVNNLTQEPLEFSKGVKNLMDRSRLLSREFRLALDFSY